MTILPNFYPTGLTRIFIQNLRLYCSIGAYPHEWDIKQKVRFNCEVWVPETKTHDQLGLAPLNYDFIVTSISHVAKQQHYHLQEYLLEQCASSLFTHPHILALRISSAKLDAYDNVEAAGVEIFRQKDSIKND